MQPVYCQNCNRDPSSQLHFRAFFFFKHMTLLFSSSCISLNTKLVKVENRYLLQQDSLKRQFSCDKLKAQINEQLSMFCLCFMRNSQLNKVQIYSEKKTSFLVSMWTQIQSVAHQYLHIVQEQTFHLNKYMLQMNDAHLFNQCF